MIVTNKLFSTIIIKLGKYQELETTLKQYNIICQEIIDYGWKRKNQETDIDHIHILLKCKPQTDLIKYINSLKGVTSRLLRQEFTELKKILWGEHFWSPSYCLITTGQVTLDKLKKYVESQGKNENI